MKYKNDLSCISLPEAETFWYLMYIVTQLALYLNLYWAVFGPIFI